MANINLLAPIIFKWEGSKVTNDPIDRGGLTKYGVTLATWKRLGKDKNYDGIIDGNDLKLITRTDAIGILKIFWNKWKADQIKNQSIANILVDWVWGSGVYGIKLPQQVLGVKSDGIVGPKTLAAINNYENQRELFQKLWNRRKRHFENICKNDPSQYRFLKGWLNRLNDYEYMD